MPMTPRIASNGLRVVALCAFLCACGESSAPQSTPASPPASGAPAAPTDIELVPLPASTPESHAPADTDDTMGIDVSAVSRPWIGDFDGMVERRRIRILTPYSRTLYAVDKGVPQGIVQEIAAMLEQTLNKQLKTTSANKLYVVVIPTSRDALYESLAQGRGDIVVAGITVTPEFEKLVDFTIPTKEQVREIVVTGPGAPPLATAEDLAGQEVVVREGSVQAESLAKLNAAFKQQGRPPVRVRTVPTLLEDEDILEMANAGLVKITVVNDFYADFWKQMLPGISLHPEIVLRDEGALAWAVRKNSPKLLATLNPIVKSNREGTLFGNMLLRKYLEDTKSVKSATSEAQIRKFNELVAIFRKYGDKYDIDYLLMMAQGYQESQLDQSVKSKVGAIGVMQVMPATGKELKVGDITQIDPNIEAGVKYMRFMVDQYFKDEPMDKLNKVLFAFASYNAGPNRIQRLRKDAAARGLDPNVWFNNVERVVAEKIGRETVTYVSNIYKYYIAYTLVLQEQEEKARAKAQGAAGT
jgi:membrane-bound lytic murein transglycosylase MltF